MDKQHSVTKSQQSQLQKSPRIKNFPFYWKSEEFERIIDIYMYNGILVI